MRPLEMGGTDQLVLVVGYDGTDPAHRALLAAADRLRDKAGRIEVVYVAHTPADVGFAPLALAPVLEGFDLAEGELTRRVDETLTPLGTKWHFQRRDGDIATELLSAAQEQLDTEGPETHVILVVGGSGHKIDRYLNSTPARVIRKDRFQVFVVP
jgi:nucleotide-binding universal stress UspA family protein